MKICLQRPRKDTAKRLVRYYLHHQTTQEARDPWPKLPVLALLLPLQRPFFTVRTLHIKSRNPGRSRQSLLFSHDCLFRSNFCRSFPLNLLEQATVKASSPKVLVKLNRLIFNPFCFRPAIHSYSLVVLPILNLEQCRPAASFELLAVKSTRGQS